MITIIDYDAGNIRSLEQSLDHLGFAYERSSDPDRIAQAELLIVPGVGQAGHVMAVIQERGIHSALTDALRRGVPTLGICIGCHIVLEYSNENNTDCLGIIKGQVKGFADVLGNGRNAGHKPGRRAEQRSAGKPDRNAGQIAEQTLKVPQIGWNQVRYPESAKSNEGAEAAEGAESSESFQSAESPQSKTASWLFAGIPQNTSFYFVNSYYPAPAHKENELAWTDYGIEFASVIGQGSLVACQFHPEKSGKYGLRLLSNFLERFG